MATKKATKNAAKKRPVKQAKGRPIRPDVPPEQVANRVAVATLPLLARLLSLPKWLVPICAVVLLFTGIAVGGVVGLLLLWTLASLLTWFLIAFWPVTPTSGRVLRSLVVLGVAAAGLFNL